MSVKNNKYFRRLAAALVTGAMLVSTLGMTVSAAPVTTVTNPASDIKIIKELDMANALGASVPAITYEYAISAGTAIGAVGSSPAILAGVGTISNVEISFNATTQIANGKAVEEAPINFSGVQFTAPGIYRYKIEQKIKNDSVTVEGIAEKDPTTLYLDLYVENADSANPDGTNYKIGYAVMHNNTGAPSLENGQYNYGDTNKKDKFTAEYKTYSLTLTKKLTGSAADLSDEFSFSINFTGGDTGETFKYIVTTNNTPGTAKMATIGTPIQVTLGDEDNVVISGIPSNLKYTITETNDKGYTATHQIKKELMGTVANGEATGEQEMTAFNNEVTFTNTKNAVTPTGVIMNIVPYVVMVALAAGLAFLFLRRRKREF